MMDHYLLETDGSYNPNHSFCGIGGALYKNGKLINYYSHLVNQHYKDHESLSLLYGLSLAQQFGISHLDIKIDSIVHANYFNHENDPFSLNLHQTLSLIHPIESILNSFASYSIEYQSREQNIIADNLAGLYKKMNGFAPRHEPIINDYFTKDMFISLDDDTVPSNSFSLFKILPDVLSEHVMINHVFFDIHSKKIMSQCHQVKNTIDDVTHFLKHTVARNNQFHCVFSGVYSETLSQNIKATRHLGYNIYESFLALQPYWNQLHHDSNSSQFIQSHIHKKVK